MSVSKLPLYK